MVDQINIGRTRSQLLWMFFALYFVQGVIQAYQLNFFKPHMDDAGIDADRIAVVASLALLPFVIKWIFGIVSDRFPLFGRGHRVPYMLIGLVGTAVAFFIAYFVDPAGNFGTLAFVVVTATFFMALFDTTADALSVDVIAPEDHGTVQAWMTAGRSVGLIALSVVFGLVADAVGYQVIFLVIAGLLLIPLRQVQLVREPDTRTPAHQFDRSAFRVLLQPRYLAFGLLLTLSWFCFQGIDGLVTFHMSDTLGASPSTIGWYGSVKGIGMIVGAVAVSLLVKRLRREWAVAATLAAVAVGGLVLSSLGTVGAFLGFGAVWGIAVGLHWTTYATVSMDITDLRIAGSMFAILQTMANIGIGAGEGVATALTDNLGFPSVMRLLAIGAVILIPIALVVVRRAVAATAATG